MEEHDREQSPEAIPRAADGVDTVETPIALDEEGLERVRIDIRRALPGRRLDKYLSGRLGKAFSRTSLQGYIREGMVTVNGRTVKPSYIIRPADVIDMLLPEIRPKEIPPEPIPLDVVYEDDDLLAINKQADIIVHPARGNWTGTLVNALAYCFGKTWRDMGDLPTAGEVFRPGIVHRLDRDTTGIMLVAKTELALWRLGRQFELRKIHKSYTAIVHGLIDRDADVIDVPIGKHPRIREKHSVHRLTGRAYPTTAKNAVTRYQVIERIGPVGETSATFSLVGLFPQTGRTHQLRVHMSFIGHPIVGDRMYGGGPIYRSQLEGATERAVGPLITRQALHAASIEFRHPRTGETVKLSAPLPEDFADTLEELKRLSRRV